MAPVVDGCALRVAGAAVDVEVDLVKGSVVNRGVGGAQGTQLRTLTGVSGYSDSIARATRYPDVRRPSPC